MQRNERSRLPEKAQLLGEAARQRAYQALANHPLLEHAQNGTVTRFLAALRLYSLPAGARLLREGEPACAVFFLTEGAVRIVHQHAESAFTPKVLAAPSHFGHMELLAGASAAFQSVDAITDAVFAELPWTEARTLLLEDHAFTLAWLEDMAQQFLHTAETIRHYAFGDLKARVANVLLSYVDLSREGDDVHAPVSIRFPLSLSALARHVACPKRSVVRILHALQGEKLIQGDKRGTLTVPDPGRLSAALPFRRLGMTHRGRLPAVLTERGPATE